MTHEEFSETLRVLNDIVNSLKKEYNKYLNDIKELEIAFARENAPLQVGQRVLVTYTKWVSKKGMTEIREYAYVRSVRPSGKVSEPFYYGFFKAKKDGSRSLLRLHEYPTNIEVSAEM